MLVFVTLYTTAYETKEKSVLRVLSFFTIVVYIRRLLTIIIREITWQKKLNSPTNF